MKFPALLLICSPLIFGEEILLETDFLDSEGFQTGFLNGQAEWLASAGVTVDAASGAVTFNEAFDFLNLSSSMLVLPWDRLTLTAEVQIDFAQDVNQTPLRLGFTTTVDENLLPIPLPTGNSVTGSTAIAGEFFREGYPFLQTKNVGHHQGTVTFAPFSGASLTEKITLTGVEANIYPHARMATFTAQNGSASAEEIQYLSSVPVASTPELTAEDVYRLTYRGEETGDLFLGSTLSEITAALESLPDIGEGNVTTTGDFTNGYEITFGGSLSGKDITQLGVIEPSTQDHVTQRMEITYDLLKRIEDKKYEITISLKNLDTGLERSLESVFLIDTHSHSNQNYYLSLRTGNLPEGGSVIIKSLKVLKEDRNGDADGDGFTNLQELSFGSDPQSLSSTPLFKEILAADFSTGAEPLNDSRHWRADLGWNISGDLKATISPLQPNLALTEEASSIEVGETIYTTTEFRLTGPANFALIDSSLFGSGISDQGDPTNSTLSAKGLLYSSSANQGAFFFDTLNLGSASHFYDSVGYDSSTLENIIQGAPRTNGPSDWMKMEIMIVKNTALGSFTKRTRISDLEGTSQGTWLIEKTFIDSDLWESPELRSGFEILASVPTEVVSGIEVRSHLALLLNAGDYDSDRLLNHYEAFYGTNSQLKDTDGDLQGDWYELENGSDPLDNNSFIENIKIVSTRSSIANNGTIQFSLTGPPGKYIRVQSSADLIDWFNTSSTPSAINTFGEASAVHYFDFNSEVALFFRVAEVVGN